MAKTWQDTVMKAGDLCSLVSREFRTATLEAKNCDGLDCEICQLQKQAEIAFKAGVKEVVEWLNTLSQNNWFHTKDDSKDLVVFHITDMMWRAITQGMGE